MVGLGDPAVLDAGVNLLFSSSLPNAVVRRSAAHVRRRNSFCVHTESEVKVFLASKCMRRRKIIRGEGLGGGACGEYRRVATSDMICWRE